MIKYFPWNISSNQIEDFKNSNQHPRLLNKNKIFDSNFHSTENPLAEKSAKMSGLSRLFKTSNDRSIVRNLLSDDSEYRKIEERTLSATKKTALIDLKTRINAFTARWNYKGMPCLWNPVFLAEYLAIKVAETKQTPGQKIFLTVWLHPMLLSIRCSLYCPAIGYKQADLDIMEKAVVKLENMIKMISDGQCQGLATVYDPFVVPDSFFPDHNKEVEAAPKSEVATATEEPPKQPKVEPKPVIIGFNPPESKPCLPKPAPTPPSETLAVKPEGIKAVITIAFPSYITFNLGNSDCNCHITTNYDPFHLDHQDNIFAENLPFMSRCIIVKYPYLNDLKLIINQRLVKLAVTEDETNNQFDDDLDSDYLTSLFLVNHSDCTTPPSDSSMSSITLKTDAPVCNRYKSQIHVTDDVPNMSLERLFVDDEEDEEEKPKIEKKYKILNDSIDSGIIIRQYTDTWKASTPDGKLLKGGKGKYSPK